EDIAPPPRVLGKTIAAGLVRNRPEAAITEINMTDTIRLHITNVREDGMFDIACEGDGGESVGVTKVNVAVADILAEALGKAGFTKATLILDANESERAKTNMEFYYSRVGSEARTV